MKTTHLLRSRLLPWISERLDPATFLSTAGATTLAVAILLPLGTQGALVWDGGYPTTGTWQNPANWNPDAAFVPGQDIIIGPVCKNNYLGGNRTVLSLTYLNTCNASFNTAFNSSGSPGGGTMNTLTFLAGNTGITIEAGSLFAHTLGNAANLDGANLVLQDNLTITHDADVNYSIVRPIIGAFGITKAGIGTGPLILSGANSYSGDTTIATGILRLGVAEVIPDGAAKGNVSVLGTLDLNAKNEIINGLSGTGIVDNNLAGNPTLSVGGNDQNSTFGGVIQNSVGTLALTKIGLGSVALSGVNTYAGATTINAGKLVGVVGGSAANSPVTLNSATAKFGVSIPNSALAWTSASLTAAAAGVLEFNFGTVVPSSTVAPLNIAGAVDFTAATPTVAVQGTSLAVGTYPLMTWGSLSGPAPTSVSLPSGVVGSLNVLGTTLRLVVTSVTVVNTKANNADNLNLTTSWTTGVVPGASDVAPWDATVTAPNTTSLGVDTTWAGIRITDPAGLVTINAGNTLTLGSAAIDINMASATADLTLNCPLVLGAANVWDVAPGQVLTLADVVSGAGAITKQGGGTAILTGGNTFSAGLTLSAGSLNLNHFSALGAAASTFTIAGGTFDNTSGGPLWLINNNPQAWNADVTFLGSQDLDLGAGSVTLNASHTVTVNGNNLTVGGTIGGGAFNLTKDGSGTLTLNGNNTISGALNMNAGTLTLAGANAFSGTANLVGGKLNLNHASALGTAALNIATIGATIDNTSGIPVTLDNNPQAWNSDFIFGGAADLDMGTGAVSLSANRTATINGGGARTFTVGGVVSGAFNLIKAGNAAMALNGLNTYSGQSIIGSGTVRASTLANAGAASSLGAPTTAANAIIQLGNSGTGTLEYTGASPAATDRQIRMGRNGNGTDNGGIVNNNADPANTITFVNPNFNAVASGAISTGARTLTLGGSNPGHNTIQGSIADNNSSNGGANSFVNITKSGPGTWVLAGANTYSGPTTLNDGKLVVVSGGSSATSSVLMSGFAATFSVAVTDNTQPWFCANLTNTGGGILEFDFGGTTPSTTVAPLLIYGEADFLFATPTINIVGDFIPTGTYPLMTWSTTSGTLPSSITLPPGVSGTLNTNGNTLELIVNIGTPLFLKANNATSLDQGSSWVGGVAPGANDSPWWDATVTAVNTTVLGADTAWKRMKITNPGGLVTISSGNTLTLSSPDKEIDMAAATASLTLNCPLILGSANVWDVALGQTLTLGGAVSGVASVTKQGEGTATLAGANSYNGSTIIKAGTMALSGAGTLGNGASGVTLAGGMLDLGNLSRTAGTVSITAPATIGDTLKNGSLTGTSYAASHSTGEAIVSARLLANGIAGLTKSGGGTLTLATNNTYTGVTTVSGGNLTLAGSNILPPANAFSLGAATLTIRNDQAGTINHGNLSITATGANVEVGNNFGATTGSTVTFGQFIAPTAPLVTATTFTGANDYKLSFSGITLPGGTGQTTTLTPNSTVITVTGNVTNPMNGYNTNNWDTLVLAGDSVGNQILGVISDATGTNAITGQPSSLANGGTTRLTKNGTSAWTISGANTYTGATTVNDGTLLVNGSVASPTNNVNGGILGGTGNLAGLVNVGPVGTIQPGLGGSSTATLTINSTVDLQGTTLMVLNRTNAQNSSRMVSQSRINGGTLTVLNAGPAIVANDTFTLFTSANVTGDFVLTNLPDISPLVWSLDPVAGKLTAVGVANNPDLGYSVSGTTLTMTWPAGYQGWYAQSNSLSVANGNAWFDIPGSELTTSLVITINPAQPQVFYRLRNP